MAQDYPADRFEIVLVDSSNPPVETLMVEWPAYAILEDKIRYFHVGRPTSIGENRNFAVRQSRGSIVMQWDDDDYYGPNRLRLQTAPIREGRARCSALRFGLWYFLDQDEFWYGPPAELGHGLNGGHPGTFTFDRTIWSEEDPRLQYPPTNFADPDDFQAAATELLRAGTEEIGSEVEFVYVRHRRAAASCEGDLRLGLEECVLGIYFEVLGVRGFGTQAELPAFVPQGTRELWARVRASHTVPAIVSPTTSQIDPGLRFDLHTSEALDLLHRNLSRYSDNELVKWTRGEALTDNTRKRNEIREVFLQEVLPALLTRLAHAPQRFRAKTLAHAVLVCSRLRHDGGGHVSVIAVALRPRLAETDPATLALAASAIDAIEGRPLAVPAKPPQLAENRAVPDRAAIVASWCAWHPQEMQHVGEGSWRYEVTLPGTTPHEFQVVVNGDHQRRLHPRGGKSAILGEAAGPDEFWQDSVWVISSCKGPEEYCICFEWCAGCPNVHWERRTWEAVD